MKLANWKFFTSDFTPEKLTSQSSTHQFVPNTTARLLVSLRFCTELTQPHRNPWNCSKPGSFAILYTNISPPNALLNMIFLFPGRDMLVPWRVSKHFPGFKSLVTITCHGISISSEACLVTERQTTCRPMVGLTRSVWYHRIWYATNKYTWIETCIYSQLYHYYMICTLSYMYMII